MVGLRRLPSNQKPSETLSRIRRTNLDDARAGGIVLAEERVARVVLGQNHAPVCGQFVLQAVEGLECVWTRQLRKDGLQKIRELYCGFLTTKVMSRF
jgi:hypothetical protein